MVKDSNSSDWIYIVKSGSLRVYKKLKKCYPCVNRRTGNHNVRAHVDGYHCFMGQQSEFDRYAMYNNVSLPPPLSADSDSDGEEHVTFNKHIVYKAGDIAAHTSSAEISASTSSRAISLADEGNNEEKENLLALPLMKRVERLLRPRTATGAIGGVIETYGHTSKYGNAKRKIRSAKTERLSPFNGQQTSSKLSTPRTPSSISNTTTEVRIDLSSVTPEVEEQTGKRTLMDDWESSARLKTTEVTAADLDPEFVLVQTLTKGQAFGVQHTLLENQPSLILVSGGAECVMLNKKVFKENIDPKMLQNLRQQVSPYPSDEDLQRNLQTRVNWLRYREITLNNLMKQHKAPKLRYRGRPFVFK